MQLEPSHGGLSYLVEASHDGVRLVCTGALDLEARGVLRDAVGRLVSDEVCGRGVVLDLTGVETIDSTGLGELVRALLICDEQGVSWSLIPSDAVRRLLALVGLGRFRSGDGGGWLSSGGYGDD
jgi:anti-anti-sigma factor